MTVTTTELVNRRVRSLAARGNANAFKHGHADRTGRSPEYAIWRRTLRRCEDPNDPDYPRYGGKGVTVYPPWHSFEKFLGYLAGEWAWSFWGWRIPRAPNWKSCLPSWLCGKRRVPPIVLLVRTRHRVGISE